ncbi:hypothetical protein PV327_011256, partial [Microctonus hyperodae]
MSFDKIVLFIILVSYTIGADSCNPYPEYVQCNHVKRKFNSMEGNWILTPEKNSQSTSFMHGAQLDVHYSTENGFESKIEFETKIGSHVKYPIIGVYHDETTVKLTGWNDE